MLALAGKVSSDLIEISLQRLKATAALLRRLLRRGRKYRMKVFAVAQEFEVKAWRSFDRIPYPCLVDVKGRFYAAQIPDLSRFQ
jgi:hypothetical protein